MAGGHERDLSIMATFRIRGRETPAWRHVLGLRGVVIVASVACSLCGTAATGGPVKVSPPPPRAPQHTGRLLVRPVQYEQLVAGGASPGEANEQLARARDRLDPWRVDLIEPIDLHVIAVPRAMTEAGLTRQLLDTGDYEYVTPDLLVYPASGKDPDDPQFPLQWQLQKIQSVQAWCLSTGDSSVVLAFADTGIDTDHPDLASALVPGYNSKDHLTEAQGGQIEDVNGHGTSVAGVAAAIGNNGVGVAGVGWDFSIMPIRVTNSSSGSAFLSDIFNGAIWAAQSGADVINVSFEGIESPGVESTGSWVRRHGGLLVWSMDNRGVQYSGFDWPDVTVVSATNPNDELYSSSSYGDVVDVAAPGVSVHATRRGGGYGDFTGTSYSAPLVTGTLGMILAADPTLSTDQAEQVLFATVEDVGEPGDDIKFGHGRINLYDAMRAILGDPPGPETEADQGPDSGGTMGDGFLAADQPRVVAPGVPVRYYRIRPYFPAGTPPTMPDFGSLSSFSHDLVDQIEFSLSEESVGGISAGPFVGAEFTGLFLAPQTGVYRFWLDSEGGSQLFIGDRLVVDNDGLHPRRERTGSVGLEEGPHRLTVRYFIGRGNPLLIASVRAPGTARQAIPASVLAFEPGPADLDRDGFVTVLDMFTFVTAFASGDLLADLTGDGGVDVLDYLAFVAAFQEGN